MPPKISSDVFAQRRQALFQALAGTPLILVAPPLRPRNRDVLYPYRMGSSFRYLTDFPEPDAVAVFTSDARFLLFVAPHDPTVELWDGPRVGPDGAVDRFGANESHPLDKLEEVLTPLLAPAQRLAFHPQEDAPNSRRIAVLLESLATQRRDDNGPLEFLRPSAVIDPMRVLKSDAEVAMLQHAADITAQAHDRLFRAARPGDLEYQLAADLHQVFARRGGDWAYPSIVATGANACVLHYIKNDCPLGPDDLVLVDAGAEFQGYCADVTRTFPSAHRYTGAAREVYSLVLDVQKDAVEAVAPGCTLQGLQERASAKLVDGLLALGVLKGDPKEHLETGSHKAWYPHGLGHFLGMDVHDVGSRVEADQSPKALEPGTLITIEPGLYFRADDDSVPQAFRGIGVRIEDDILVTPDGHRSLTKAIPKEMEAIEALRAEALV